MSPTTRDLGRSTGLTSSISRIKLSARVVTVWRRSKAKINRLLTNEPPTACAKHESTDAARPTRPFPSPFPHDIVEMIVAHLTHHHYTLKMCSLTCRSWYIAATRHLHHTFTFTGIRPEIDRSRLEPLSKLHELGLIPLVKEIRVRRGAGGGPWFLPRAFSPIDLQYFSAFSNVHTLNVENMQIHRFIPGIERYFEHFSPTLRSVALYNPCCTPRQLSYFLSLFPNLDDIDIDQTDAHVPNPTIPDTELVLFSAPKLQGRLTLRDFRWVEPWTHLTSSCGDLRFRHMDLREVGGCAPVLLEACAETLETLRFNTRDGSVRARPPPYPEFGLSRLKVLRSLQVEGWVADPNLIDHCNTAVTEVFSTITSPAFSELVIVLAGRVACLRHEARLFETLRRMNEIRPFELVFSLEAPSFSLLEARRTLEDVLESATVIGLLDFLDSPPSIRIARSRFYEWDLFFLDFF